MDDVRRISQSELKDYQRCKRRWWLKHVRRLTPKLIGPVGALQSGTRVHTALEAYYTPGNDGDPRAVLEEVLHEAYAAYVARCLELETDPDQFVLQQFSKDAELERAMVEGYCEWLAESGADAHLTVVAAEQYVSVTDEQLGAQLLQPFNVVGKLDARVIDEVTETRRFMDHKTLKSFATQDLRQDPQMLHYHLLETFAAAIDGETCSGAIYNMLRKVKRTKTSKPPYFARETIDHNADEIESYRLRLLGLITNIFELEDRIARLGDEGVRFFAYPNPTRDCAWDCDFVQICTMFDDGSRVEDAIRDMFEERDPLARYANDQVQ